MTGAPRSLGSLAARLRPAGLVMTLAACGAEAAPVAAPATPAKVATPAPLPVGARADGPSPSPELSVWPFAPLPTDAELAEQLARATREPGPLRTNWTPPGKTERYGHAEGLVAAPYEVVKARLLDFAHYKDLAGPKFKKVSLVDRTAAGTDLYFQLPIMKGIVTLWYVTRFTAARPGMNGAEIIVGSFVRGNIKDMQIAFTLRPAPEQRTLLVCDLNLAITLPAPQELLDEELRDACGDAVNAVRARTASPPRP